MNHHLIIMEGFVCLSDPRDYVVWSNLPLVGSPVADGPTPRTKKQFTEPSSSRTVQCTLQEWGTWVLPWSQAQDRVSRAKATLAKARHLDQCVPARLSPKQLGLTRPQLCNTPIETWRIRSVTIHISSVWEAESRLTIHLLVPWRL